VKTTFHISDRAVKLIRWSAFTAIIALAVMSVGALVLAANQDHPSDSRIDPRCSMTENWVVTDKTHGRVVYEQVDLDSLDTYRFWISCPNV